MRRFPYAVSSYCPSVRTWSWIAMARRSQGRTPRKAYDGGSGSCAVKTTRPSGVRSALHSRSREGCRYDFQDCGPALCAKAAPSSRGTNR